VFLDGVFTAALYRRLSLIEHRHWLKSALARTRAPLLWTLLFFALFGSVAHWYAPEAISIGGVVQKVWFGKYGAEVWYGKHGAAPDCARSVAARTSKGTTTGAPFGGRKLVETVVT
jgi:hypothetical protein